MARRAEPTVDAYLAKQPEPARGVLARVRATIRAALPGAAESISYQIPEYKLGGRMVLYFAGFAKHYSIYPATPAVIAAMPELAEYLHSKATVRLAYDEAVPTRLITRFAKLRAAEAEAGTAKTSKAKPAKTKPAKTKPAKSAKRRAGARAR